ncbi:unnamed protein product [Orchesella dallaii]|uniref:Uncharacterized protein n=1 Tax=Orchesella dallaii TaxID=48710 RepID=A0ABP1QME8_9HEXA
MHVESGGIISNPNASQLEYVVKAMMCSYPDLDLNGNCTAQQLMPTNIDTLSPMHSVDQLLHDDFTDERDSVMFEDDDDSNDES